jgi:hypothetical protein
MKDNPAPGLRSWRLPSVSAAAAADCGLTLRRRFDIRRTMLARSYSSGDVLELVMLMRKRALRFFVALVASSWQPIFAEPPLPLSPAELDSLEGVYPQERSLILDEWLELDVRYDVETDGYHGEMNEGREVWLKDMAAVEEYSRTTVQDGPLHRLRGVWIEIVSSGGKRRKFDKGDLNWISQKDRNGRVYHLDQVISCAVIPGLAAGDRVRIRRQHELHGVPGLPQYQFGGRSRPCVRSTFSLALPEDHELTYALQGPDGLRNALDHEQEVQRGRIVHRWRMTGLEARGEETFSAGEPSNHLVLTPHVLAVAGWLRDDAFAVGRDWAAAARGYRNRIASSMATTPELDSLARQLVGDLQDRWQRIDAIYSHVQRSCRYLGLFEGLGGVIPEPAAVVAVNGYGDCKGLGVYLITLLRAAGIEAQPVLLRTRDRGPLAVDVPNMMQFNHFIVWADDGGEGLWLDATLDGCPAGVVPVDDASSPVLSHRPGLEGLQNIPLTAWDPGALVFNVQGELDSLGMLNLEVTLEATSGAIAAMRGWTFRHSESAQKEAITEVLLPTSLPMDTRNTESHEQEDWRRSIRWILTAAGRRPLPGVKNQLFFPKILPNLPQRRIYERDRRTDLDLRSRPARREIWAISLPPGYRMAGADTFAVEVPGLSWRRLVWQEDRWLRLHREIIWSSDILPAVQAGAVVDALDAVEEAEMGFLSLATAIPESSGSTAAEP